ncbi:hypothetical protein J3R30DRAFT_2131082 [Lentinula aciculospora]|uniref:Uncharacterized protein n=1 Tax=Lentinula aciculospora TaxID=153920 RepID=A0A9W9AHR1_9AGAR|nr:hypothetical protein J3R30DRAFT_2131082 [Lentinula aciculospora]
MGGSAFNVLLANSFPRIPSPVYQALKARLTPVLQQFYINVAVPAEAPEKIDHGDLDFVVCNPRESTSYALAAQSVNVPHELVKAALGASHCILEEGNRTSNFAVAVDQGAWRHLGCAEQEEKSRQAADMRDIFYQIDVRVCEDENEWERVVYFHSYGDLGMIQGLVASNVGLVLGANGLKFRHPPHPTLTLSQDFSIISRFFGWSYERQRAGFKTREEAFKWVAESRFFDPRCFQTRGEGIRKVKAQRTMYSDFVAWVHELSAKSGVTSVDLQELHRRRERVREEALVEFGRQDEVETYLREFEGRKKLKNSFNGTVVNAWIGSNGNWRKVKTIMNMVREQHGGEEGILQILMTEGDDGLKQRVISVSDKFAIAE